MHKSNNRIFKNTIEVMKLCNNEIIINFVLQRYAVFKPKKIIDMSVNKVILVGNVGKDPEMKYFDNDNAIANFSVATNERGFTTSSGTQIPDRTEWHNVVCRRGLAQIAEKFVKKGTLLYIEGKIRTRSYDDQSGVKRYITEIVADSLELLSRKGGGEYEPSAPKPESAPQNSTKQDFDDTSDVDDLPF
jgi:single-strand DNA-binding protein